MIRMTLGEMIKEVGSFISDTSPDSVAIIRAKINQNYDQIARMHPWRELMGFINEGMTFVADTNYLALPGDAQEIIQLSDKTSNYTLQRKQLTHMVQDNINIVDSSGSQVLTYSDLGYQATKRPLSIDDKVEIVGELTTDTSVEVRISGLRSDPEVEDRETIITNSDDSQTGVTGAITFREGWSIRSLSVNQPLNGYIEIRENATGTNVLAHITELRKDSQYLVLQFQNPPASADNLNVIYKKRVSPLQKDDDVPVIAASEAIVESTIAAMRRYEEQYSQAREHERLSGNLIGAAVVGQKSSERTSFQSRPDRRSRRFVRGY